MNAMTEDSNVPESQFQLLRCIISIAHSDGIIQEEEREFIENMIRRLGLSDAREEILEDDFKHPKDPLEIFDNITDPKFRSQAIHFAKMIAWKDGELDPKEQDIIHKLQKHATEKSAGFDDIEPDVENYFKSSYNQSEVPENTDRKSVVKNFFDRIFGQ